ncbi:MAG: hypothetical protein JNK82_27585 [Myxococcaceae bacterium]|nr:hypothetical protein [Myxococcaceae bacterium]
MFRFVAACLSAAALTSLPAQAQLLEQPLEALLPDGGLTGWRLEGDAPGAGGHIRIEAAAAHRGSFGLRFTDDGSAARLGPGPRLGTTFSFSSPQLYSRVWLRAAVVGGSGNTRAFWSQWATAQGGPNNAHSFQISARGEVTAGEQGVLPDGGSRGRDDPTGFKLDGGWHLLEAATFGAGSDSTAGVTLYRFDGLDAGRHSGVSAWADRFVGFSLGSAYAFGTFGAQLDFDDVRVSTQPLATRLALRVDGPLVARACNPVVVSLQASMPAPDGGEAAEVTATAPVLLAVGGALLYADDGCTEPLDGGATLATGAARLTLFVAPPIAGAYTLTARQRDGLPDFFDAELLTTAMEPDADGGEPVNLYALRCGAGPGGLLVAALLLLVNRARSPTATARARRRRAARTARGTARR